MWNAGDTDSRIETWDISCIHQHHQRGSLIIQDLPVQISIGGEFHLFYIVHNSGLIYLRVYKSVLEYCNPFLTTASLFVSYTVHRHPLGHVPFIFPTHSNNRLAPAPLPSTYSLEASPIHSVTHQTLSLAPPLTHPIHNVRTHARTQHTHPSVPYECN